jgi:hypothetical protein
LRANSVASLTSILRKFADSSQRIGQEVSLLKPPANAAAANAELARGERDTANATRAAAKTVGG